MQMKLPGCSLPGRLLSQPFFVAEIFTGKPGRFVELPQTIDSFEQLLKGERDDIPEAAFYMVGDMDEVRGGSKAQRSQGSAGKPRWPTTLVRKIVVLNLAQRPRLLMAKSWLTNVIVTDMR